jgi:MtrB/PioB family decaheme-associated outer membrane protein
MSFMNRNGLTLVAAAVATALGSPASAADAPRPDTSKWVCKRCPFDYDYRADAELGALYVSEDSAKFGDYTGLNEKGGYVVADAEGKSTRESGYSLEYSLQDLGLDSRSAWIEGGKQGSYDFFLGYDAIPKYRYDTSETPYLGTGGNNLKLPSGWVRGGNTADMSSLPGALRPVDVEYDRETYGVGGRFFASDKWKFALAFRRQDRSGTGIAYGGFVGRSAQLHKPVEYTTDIVDASVRYGAETWDVELAYYASMFDNQYDSLRWANAYTIGAGEPSFGQMALEPDNDFQQVLLSGSKRFGDSTVLSGTFSTGRGSQDQSFLPYTVNPTLGVDALPISNLDGDVKTTHYDVAITSRLTSLPKLRLKGWVRYDERDNSSKTGTFSTPVVGDSYLGRPVVNPGYSFERTRYHGSAEYEVIDDLGLAIGGEYAETDRTEVAVRSEEVTNGWMRANWRPMNGLLDLRATAGVDRREPDKYLADPADGQNPLMRKYNMAYRYREYLDFHGSWSHAEIPVSVGLGARYADDSYSRSEIGLISGSDGSISGDVSYLFSERTSGYLSLGYEDIKAKQKNSEYYADPDWRAKRSDEFLTAGVGLRSKAILAKLDLDIDYTYAQSIGRTKLDSDLRDLGRFPDLETELNSLRVNLTYHLSDRFDVLFGWWWEKFDSKDWSIQGVQPDTVLSVLSMGADPYNYDVNVISLSGRYAFGARPAAADDAKGEDDGE